MGRLKNLLKIGYFAKCRHSVILHIEKKVCCLSLHSMIRLLLTLLSFSLTSLIVFPAVSRPNAAVTDTLAVDSVPVSRKIGEVVVTASENTSLTSGSRIGRAAMAHLQPTSFTDLLELLPGNMSMTPTMGQVNSITLRETGFSSPSGSTSVTDDYAISSLGTAFVVDGAAINNDASMSQIPGATSGDAAYLRSTVNRGVDMRTISTDNIESVEVMRGIPSAEYGNLTSGVVNIRRIRRATPLTARFKADEYSNLFSVGKGVVVGSYGDVINADLSYLDSKTDPRPRNTTGRLDNAVGGAVRLGSSDYHAGVSGSFRKYKQSCDIEFVNELSDNSIWHLTGLGTHYERFAGNGYSHYYNGNRYGVSANLFPSSRRGAVASVEFTSFSFDHILTGLNKLPLQSATDNRLALEAGWLAPGRSHDLAGFISLGLGRRNGNENLFGDPTSGICPQIGSLRLYTHSLTSAGVSLLWQWHHPSGMLLAVNPRIDWNRSKESYADPRRELLLSLLTPPT